MIIWLSQYESRSSVSAWRVRMILLVHGFRYALGSSMVTVSSRWPKSTRRHRSVTFSASLFGYAMFALSQPWSRNPMLSTTNASPSQWPTEYPSQAGSVSLNFGSGRPSVKICRKVLPTYDSWRKIVIDGVCTILNGVRWFSRGTPKGRQYVYGSSTWLRSRPPFWVG